MGRGVSGLLGMERKGQLHLGTVKGCQDWPCSGCPLLFQVALRQEDGDETAESPASGRRDRRRASVCSGGGVGEHRALDRRRSRRHSVQSVKSPLSAPTSPCSQSAPGFKPSQVRDLREK